MEIAHRDAAQIERIRKIGQVGEFETVDRIARGVDWVLDGQGELLAAVRIGARRRGEVHRNRPGDPEHVERVVEPQRCTVIPVELAEPYAIGVRIRVDAEVDRGQRARIDEIERRVLASPLDLGIGTVRAGADDAAVPVPAGVITTRYIRKTALPGSYHGSREHVPGCERQRDQDRGFERRHRIVLLVH